MYLTTRDLYHSRECESDLMQMIGHKAEKRSESADELEEKGYDPCSECIPERAEG